MKAFWLLNPGGARYAVEAEGGMEVGAAPPLFRPPLSDPSLAGLAPVGDRTLVVADLAACLGLPPAPSSPRLLLRPGGERAAVGFLLRGEAERIETDGKIVPLPEGLRQGSVESCLLVDGLPVPLVNLRRLQEEFAGEEPSTPLDLTAALPAQKGPAGKNWRIVWTAGRRFALPKSLFPDPPRPRPALSPLGRAPAPLAGLFADEGAVLPAWSLGALLGESATAEEGLLVGAARGVKVGLLVEREGEETALLPPFPLPRWGGRPGIEKALVRDDGEIVPCLRLRGLPAAESWPGEEPPAPAHLSAGPWEIVEFRLGGTVQAVPKTDLVDLLPLRPWRRIPGVPGVVEGVSWWQDELWPVINLSSYFGPLAAAGVCSMLALQRGEHRLLLPVESFIGERRVAPGEQRQLPVELPHPLVAGCYLDQGGVGLVLDIPALVHYFEPSVVQSFRAIIAGDREETAASDRNVSLPLTAPLVPAPPGEVESPPVAPAPALLPTEVPVGEFPAEFAEELPDEPAAEKSAGETMAETMAEREEEEPEAVAVEAVGGGAAEEPAAECLEAEGEAEMRVEELQVEPVEAPAVPTPPPPAQNEDLPETTAGTTLECGAEPSSPEDRQENRPEIEEEVPMPAEEAVRAPATEETLSLAGAFADLGEEDFRRGERVEPPPARPAAPGLAPEPEPAEPAEPAEEPPALSPGAPAPVASEEKPLAPPPSPLPLRPTAGGGRRPGWRTAAAVSVFLAASLVGGLLWRGEPERSPRQSTFLPQGESRMPAAAAPAVPEVARAVAEEGSEASPRWTEAAPPAGEEGAPYTVTRGDTLWGISERFLRNPYRYDDLARANRIPNPHRIYPGQVIRIDGEPEAGTP